MARLGSSAHTKRIARLLKLLEGRGWITATEANDLLTEAGFTEDTATLRNRLQQLAEELILYERKRAPSPNQRHRPPSEFKLRTKFGDLP